MEEAGDSGLRTALFQTNLPTQEAFTDAREDNTRHRVYIEFRQSRTPLVAVNPGSVSVFTYRP